MPTPEEIASEQEKLYESASLRDDLNDAEGEVLLKWGEIQVEHMAKTFPEEFEQKARFLRQLLKNINRFVGQREFNDKKGQREYLANVVKYLEPLGYSASEESLFAALPDDPKDMMANLKAIITTLTPDLGKPAMSENPTPAPDNEPTADETPKVEFDTQTSATPLSAIEEQEIPAVSETTDDDHIPTFHPNTDKTEVIPDISHLIHDLNDDHNIFTTEKMPKLPTTESPKVDDDTSDKTLENPDTQGITQPDSADSTGENAEHGTTTTDSE